MASTTTNLGLMKPAYSDDADISDINGNMDLIDAEAGRVRANVAANYDSSETYAVGDYCLHDGSLYKCSTAISSPEAWTAGHWTQIKITGELSALNGNIANRGARTKIGTKQGTGTATLSDSILNYKYLCIMVGYYDSGFPNYGTYMVPVSCIAINASTTYDMEFGINSETNIAIGFNSATELRVTAIFDTNRHVVIFGIK